MRTLLFYCVSLLFVQPAARAESRLWKISAAILTAATTVDAASSWGHAEANPLLRGTDGRFGYKAVSLKAAITGGALVAQHFLMKDHPKSDRYGAITNLALSGVFTAAAVSNFQRTAVSSTSPR